MRIYTIDNAGRLCLGKENAGKQFKMTTSKTGIIELIPVKVIPEHEAWLYENKEALNAVQEGLEQAKEGKTGALSFNLEDDELWLEDEPKQERGSRGI